MYVNLYDVIPGAAGTVSYTKERGGPGVNGALLYNVPGGYQKTSWECGHLHRTAAAAMKCARRAEDARMLLVNGRIAPAGLQPKREEGNKRSTPRKRKPRDRDSESPRDIESHSFDWDR